MKSGLKHIETLAEAVDAAQEEARHCASAVCRTEYTFPAVVACQAEVIRWHLQQAADAVQTLETMAIEAINKEGIER